MHLNRLSRRRWLETSLATLGAAACSGRTRRPLLAASPVRTAGTPPNRFPEMLQEYFLREARAARQMALHRQADLKTKAQAEAYVAEVRSKIAASFGRWPERTPLEPQITGVVKRDAYVIEKVIFQSRPRFYVTANLYVPKHAAFPAPGVVGACGHSQNGKACAEFQAFAQGLVRQGYVVLIFDPIGQGERLQYPDGNLQSRVGWGSREHTAIGNQQFLVGEFLGSWMAWDGIRALDYLLSREEVDPRHVGVTGSSGGGMQTTWLCSADPRWTMAAPSCFVTTFLQLLVDETSNDTEQCPPRVFPLGIDHADFLAAMAPKPVIVLAQEEDFVDIRGTLEAFENLRKIYGLLGAADQVKLYVGPGGHGYPRESREQMYRWFNTACGKPSIAREPEVTIEHDRTLQCTKSGQVVELGSRPVYSYTKEAADKLAKTRSIVSGITLRRAVAELLKLPPRPRAVDYRILRPRPTPGCPLPFVSTYAVETEPGIFAVVGRQSKSLLYSRPPRADNAALLYVAHESSDVELREESLLGECLEAEPAATLYTCDVRGIGQSRSNSFGSNADYMYAIHSIMLDRPYVGQRTGDVLAVVDWLRGFGHREVHLVGRGYGSIPAAFAALMHESVTRITLKNAPTSYYDIAATELYGWPLSSLVPGVLKRFDMPDVYRELAAKRLRLVEPWGGDRPPKTT